MAKSGPAEVFAGEPIAWTLTVKNNGRGDSSGYTVTDDVPASVTGVQSTTPGCAVDANRVVCEGAPLAAGEERTIAITGKAPATGGAIENRATVTGREPDPKDANNSASSSTVTRTVSGLCRATPLAALGLRPGEANGAETPCRSDSHALLRLNADATNGLLGRILPSPVRANVLEGATVAGKRSATARASVAEATVVVAGVTLSVTGVHSAARSELGANCRDSKVSGSSRIATLVLNGKSYPVGDQPLTIPLPGLGGVHVNKIDRDGSLVDVKTVFVDLPGTALDVVVGQSKAQVRCS